MSKVSGESQIGFALTKIIFIFGTVALILGMVVIATTQKCRVSAEVSPVRVSFDQLAGKLMEYRILGGTYPSEAQGLKALVSKPSTDPIPRNYNTLCDELPLDPWDKEFRYKFPGSKNPAKPEIISAGPDGQFETEDDLSSQDQQY